MTILLTGGTGKTVQKMLSFLTEASTHFVLTSRSPSTSAVHPTAKFDYTDPTTFSNPFNHPSLTSPITAIYLVPALGTPDAEGLVIKLIEYAFKEHGVKRFVLLAGSSTNKGVKADGSFGMAWKKLDELGVEYTVLRCSWFMEDFSELQHVSSLKEEKKLYSACADGKVPYVSTTDIAHVAFCLLTRTSGEPLPETVSVRGQELLTMDQVASIFSSVLGTKVENVRMTKEERKKDLQKRLYMPPALAEFMTWLELYTAAGGEDGTSDDVKVVTGREPITFKKWVEKNKVVWE